MEQKESGQVAVLSIVKSKLGRVMEHMESGHVVVLSIVKLKLGYLQPLKEYIT